MAVTPSRVDPRYVGNTVQCWNTTTDLVPSADALGYVVGATIGSGSYAKVKAAWSPTLRKQVAIKVVDKLYSKEKHLNKFLTREIAVLGKLNHPHVLKTYRIVQTDERCYIVMELAHNGDLLDHINDRKKLTEGEARFFFQQICDAVHYCHCSNIVHRDVKCENVMLDRNYNVKLGDFGFALNLRDDNLSTPCGSKSYAAPEVHMVCEDSKTIDAKKADVWSLGVVLFAMVTGNLPFLGKTTCQSYCSKTKPLRCPDYLSPGIKLFLNYIFTKEPEKRPNASELLSSAWTRSLPCTSPLQSSNSAPLSLKYTIDSCFSESTARNIQIQA